MFIPSHTSLSQTFPQTLCCTKTFTQQETYISLSSKISELNNFLTDELHVK
jgi:hypothetical protein